MTTYFTPEEQRIRKRWLIAWVGMLLFELFQGTVASFSYSDPLLMFLLISLFYVGFYGITYYLSYKKNGFKWLNFAGFYPLMEFFKNLAGAESRIESVGETVVLIVFLGIYCWWCYASVQLTNLNRRLHQFQERLRKPWLK